MPVNIHLPTAGLIGVSALGASVIDDLAENPVFTENTVTIITGSTDRVIEVPSPHMEDNEHITNGSVIIFKLKTTNEGSGFPTITLRGQGTGTDKVRIEGMLEDIEVQDENSIVTMYYVNEAYGWIFGPGTVTFS